LDDTILAQGSSDTALLDESCDLSDDVACGGEGFGCLLLEAAC
jgi:hypothetical protein